MKIRIGLSKFPEDRESREFLAQIYYMSGLVDPAHDLMLEGIELGIHDTDYLSSFFKLCFESDAFQSVLDASELVLADPEFSGDPEKLYFINRYKVTSMIEMGLVEEAYALAHEVNTNPEGKRRMIDAEYLALIKSGKPVDALVLLEKWRFRMEPGSIQLQNL